MTSTKSSTMTIKHLLIALMTCLTVLGLSELIAKSIHDTIWYPSTYQSLRNPFFQRGWEYYTQPQPPIAQDEDVYRVIIISNSQGFMVERRDAREAYPYLLEQTLSEQMNRTVRVLNWSVVGINAAEQIILASQAINHKPDMVLWIAHNDNLSRAQNRRLLFYGSDIGRLAYHPSVRQYLGADFLATHSGNDPLQWLLVNTNLGKLAHVFDADRYFTWWWDIRLHGFQAFYYSWNDASVAYARQFYDTLQRGAEPIPMAFVSMPLNSIHYDEDMWAGMTALPARMDAVYQSHNMDVRVYDATDVIPNELFYTSTHMIPDGHAVFAQWLIDNVEFVDSP